MKKINLLKVNKLKTNCSAKERILLLCDKDQ